ncbi:alpha/beta fold hydrolase [Promicromonospora sp. Populi]|uniref:alpha/beta fold hydrolase n=1 Tax=Promicromonospora sp. Populi TaxID=3239420 RepID=UPI0034E1E9EF
MIPAYTARGDGPPLVLVMGLGAPGDRWQPHVDAWSQHFRCIAVDNRGTGDTPRGDAPPTAADLADDVAGLVRALGVGPVHVAGISMGGAVAQELAITHPELVEKMVLVAPWSAVPPSTAATLEILERARASEDRRLFNLTLQRLIWTPDWIDAHAAELAAGLDDAPAMSVGAFADQVHACATVDTHARLGTVRTPTLVTWGERDVFIAPELSAATASAIDGAETAVFSTGHVHHWEELARFNQTVEEWLR